MLHDSIRAWTDLDPSSRFRNAAPNVIIRADTVANGEYDSMQGDDFRPGQIRRVAYFDTNDTSPTYWYQELVLYKHQAGAGSLAIYSGGASLCRGRLLGEDGAFTGAKENVSDIAGGMLSNYCNTTSYIGNGGVQSPVWAESLEEGDYIWLVRGGRYEILSDGTITAGSNLVTDNSGGTDGAAQDSVTTIASIAEIQENIMFSGKCIGQANASAAGGYADITLDLGKRVTQPS